MAEVQTHSQSGELSQRFIEFVMMQAQNAALFLGQIPNPQSGQAEVNLEFAKMFIDQLAMIQEKTRGNLTTEESAVLRNTLSNLQMAFVEVSRQSGGAAPVAPKASAPETPATDAPSPSQPEQPQQGPETPQSSGAAPEQSESRKKFTKSYGA